MGIGYRIKEARERLGLTQTELGLRVGVTGSAITNYEKETSHPKEQVIYKLMEVLCVDANYLFQDCMRIPPKDNDISLSEYDLIKKYRALDDDGKLFVDSILDREYNRTPISEGQISFIPVNGYTQIWHNGHWENFEKVDDTDDIVNAAHSVNGSSDADKKHDEDIMDSSDF